jgi:hypothetical protein
MQNIRAEVVLPTKQLRDDIPFFTKTLGMRMDEIFPADDPSVAVFSGYGLRVRVQKDAQTAPGVLRILCDDPMLIADGQTHLTAPNGTRIEIAALAPPVVMPPVAHEFVMRRMADQAPLGHWTRRHALSRSYSQPFGRFNHRQPYPYSWRRACAGYGAFPLGRISADLLLQRLGGFGL